MTQRAYNKGSTAPALEKDTLRIYSNRFCPYAYKTRMVLSHKAIPFELINVNITEKPDWLFDKNPLGLTPILQYNDKIIYESNVCDEFLEDQYPDKPVLPKDPFMKAQHRIIMAHADKWSAGFITLMKKSQSMTDDERTTLKGGLDSPLKQLEQGLGCTNFYGGDLPGLVDYHMWPFFELFRCVKEKPMFKTGDLVPLKDYPNMNRWMERMPNTPAVIESATGPELVVKYSMGYLEGKANHDLGLLD